jgi:hypothetical protein
MDKKKALIIGGSVAAGSLLLYFLTRKRAAPQGASDDFTPAPNQTAQAPNPLAILFQEGLSIFQDYRKNREESKLTSTEGAAVSQPSYLKRGSKGSKVVALQKYLNQSSGAGLEIDGDFGPNTETAVKSEQDPFSNFKFMYPDSVYGAISKTYYDMFVKSFE